MSERKETFYCDKCGGSFEVTLILEDDETVICRHGICAECRRNAS